MARRAYEVLIKTPQGVKPYSVWADNDDEAMERAKSMYASEQGLPFEKKIGKADVATETAGAAGRDGSEMSRYRHARWTRDLANAYGNLPAAAATGLWELIGAAGWAGRALQGEAEPVLDYISESVDDIKSNMAGMRTARSDATAREQEGMLFGHATGMNPEDRRTLIDDEYVQTDKTFGRRDTRSPEEYYLDMYDVREELPEIQPGSDWQLRGMFREAGLSEQDKKDLAEIEKKLKPYLGPMPDRKPQPPRENPETPPPGARKRKTY